MKYLKLILCLCLIFTACVKVGTKFKYVKLKSFIAVYYEPLNLKVYTQDEQRGFIVIRLDRNLDDCASFLSEGEDYDKYIALCNKYNDLSYNKEVLVLTGITSPHFDFEHSVVNYNPSEIIVTSSSDFDENHKAGTPLNDLINITLVENIYSFIQKGYPESFDGDGIGHDVIEGTRTIPLNEITEEDMILMFNEVNPPYWNHAKLVFHTEPTLLKDHTITVTLKSKESEKEFSGTTNCVFKPLQ